MEGAGHDGETADDYAGGHFGGGPEAHAEDVVRDVGALDDFPGVVGAEDGGYACAEGGGGW